MNYKFLFYVLFFTISCTAQVDESLRYLKQTPPSNVPVVFAPNLISLNTEYEFGSVFNKSGTEFFYGVDVDGRSEIRYTQLKNEIWTLPKVILSDERYGYNDQFFLLMNKDFTLSLREP